MTYLIETERHGYTETNVDMNALTTDLAALLGGTVEIMDDDWRGGINMPNGLRIFLSRRGYGVARNRITVSASAPRQLTDWLGSNSYGRPGFPETTFDPARPLKSIAAAIVRKVIEPGAEPLAAIRADFDKWQGITQGVTQHADALRAAYPDVRMNLDTSRPQNRADFSFYRDGVSLSGHMNSDGAIDFDRLRVTPDQARAILAMVLGAPRA